MKNIEILAPRISANDDYVTIGEWLIKNGSRVKKDDEIASLETTKKTEVLLASADGYVFYNLEAGEDVAVGAVIAIISESSEFQFETEKSELSDYTVTQKALELIRKNRIDVSVFSKNEIIREKDVLKILNKGIEVDRSKANDIVIVGGGGLAKMYIDLIRLNKSYNIHGIIDAEYEIGTNILGVPVIGRDEDLPRIREEGYMTAINAIGSISADNTSAAFELRQKIAQKIKDAGFFMPTLIHPSADIAPSAQIGEGVVIMEKVVVGPDAIIGDDVLLNTGCIVAHDCIVGRHARISPGAVLGGAVKIGENALIGMGATVYLGLTIGNSAVVTNGKNVFSNVKEFEVVN